MNHLLTKSRTAGALSLLLLSGALAACGGNNNENGGASPSASSPAASSAGASSSAPAASADPTQLSGTVKVWDWDEAFQKGMIAEFNKKVPEYQG
ncbi:hypothetical protein OMP38_31985 [Cohnella ginsengisoli]|uniref:ABC transporter substrate-binding protein n=1 Tax=Cohnella ginsengisoli TaxID=425004 RepID=A0A9X4KN06_9BACL|nr:hypothetical protein [Cohnella ginsengisoli]MDG0794935.1 hypothetical protein [Cohnella ginsengisoli]